MGKATILSHLGDGQYSITYHRDTSKAQTRVAELEKLQSDLDQRLIDLDAALTKVGLEYDAASQAFTWALEDWADCAKQLPPCHDLSTLKSAVMERGKERAAKGMAVQSVRQSIAEAKAQQLSVLAEIAYLNNTAKADEVMSVWCADWHPSHVIPASTVVGTIETYGAKPDGQYGYLPDPHINIVPSFADDYAYSASRDRCVRPASSVGPATLAYNYMQWLYVMSHNPLYAVGNLDAKNEEANTATVTLYGATPTSNQPDNFPFVEGQYSVTLTNVPVVYESCHAKAFTVGDDVIVRFVGVNRANPTVIGFAENPKRCGLSLQYFAEENGSIIGEAVQEVMPGEDGTLVCAAPASGYEFTAWSDGYPAACRQDLDVTEDVVATAGFAVATGGLPVTFDLHLAIYTLFEPDTTNYPTGKVLGQASQTNADEPEYINGNQVTLITPYSQPCSSNLNYQLWHTDYYGIQWGQITLAPSQKPTSLTYARPNTGWPETWQPGDAFLFKLRSDVDIEAYFTQHDWTGTMTWKGWKYASGGNVSFEWVDLTQVYYCPDAAVKWRHTGTVYYKAPFSADVFKSQAAPMVPEYVSIGAIDGQGQVVSQAVYQGSGTWLWSGYSYYQVFTKVIG